MSEKKNLLTRVEAEEIVAEAKAEVINSNYLLKDRLVGLIIMVFSQWIENNAQYVKTNMLAIDAINMSVFDDLFLKSIEIILRQLPEKRSGVETYNE